MFELTPEEYRFLRSQIASLEVAGRGKHSKYPPFAFTEHGVTALANVLNSDKAVEMGIAVVRAFIALRQIAISHGRLAQQIEDEKRLLEQRIDEHDVQLAAIYDSLENLLDKKAEEEERLASWRNKERIGFKS
jgi:phage regulator Rha-like protein